MFPFRKRKTKVEYITPEFYKDWGNAQYELECLGHRLDAVRQTINQLIVDKRPENDWALRHWREVESVILRRWKHTVRLKDTGLRQKQTWDSGPQISYDWWEDTGFTGYGFADRLFDKYFGKSDFAQSWERARDLRIEMARKGLA